jgi:HAD superfamily hydrolase (TIGR01509 family)
MIHLRKPDPKAFIHVCTEEGFAPADTILVDDSILNCLAATELGIQTLRWVEH